MITLKGTAIAAGKVILLAAAAVGGAILATKNETVGETVKEMTDSALAGGKNLCNKLTKKNEEPAAPEPEEPSAGE